MRLRGIDTFAFGFSWVADEPMRRASHALADDGRVWLVDPLDEHDAIKRAQGLGRVAAVVQLLDRHNRDCATIAERLGVPHLRVPDSVPGSPFEAIAALRLPRWRETALWWPRREALVVAEVLAGNPMHTGGEQKVGMHLFLRAWPPGSLREYRPQHLLLGHGHALHGAGAAAGVETAYARSRRDLPRVLAGLPGTVRG
jgi:hypothetical protein